MTDRKTRLWNAWLATDDGSKYEAGWSDLWTQLHAARGTAWVAERIMEEDAAEIERLTAEIARLREAEGIDVCAARRLIRWLDDPSRKPAVREFPPGLSLQVGLRFEAALGGEDMAGVDVLVYGPGD